MAGMVIQKRGWHIRSSNKLFETINMLNKKENCIILMRADGILSFCETICNVFGAVFTVVFCGMI